MVAVTITCSVFISILCTIKYVYNTIQINEPMTEIIKNDKQLVQEEKQWQM